VFSGENILPGLTGLVASRLASHFNIPALVVSFAGDTAKASLRSSREYNLSFLLDQCSDLFLRYGGHDFAAGFSLSRNNWEIFLERLKGLCRNMELKPEGAEHYAVDAEIPLSYLSKFEENPGKHKKDLYVLRLVDDFEPAGEGCPPLLFLSRGLLICDIQLVGKEARHVKMTLDTGKLKWPGLYWNAAGKITADFDIGSKVDIVYNLGRNWFNGSETPQMIIRDVKRNE
jgi:single-stranded-DNA-specific exonuclease